MFPTKYDNLEARGQEIVKEDERGGKVVVHAKFVNFLRRFLCVEEQNYYKEFLPFFVAYDCRLLRGLSVRVGRKWLLVLYS